jgi:LysM repeat protein
MAVVRRGARFLAPLALILTIVALYVIVHRQLRTTHISAATVSRTFVSATTTTGATATRGKHKARKPSVYVVRSGDTLSNIAVKAGISLNDLESLNPNINPNSLQAGQRLRLR